MENCEPLVLFGTLVLLVTGGLIVVPYLRGKADLLSAWTILLLGIAIYYGCGSFEAVYNPMRFRRMEWFNPSKEEVTWFMSATALFIAVLIATYYYNPLSKITARTFNKWPPQTAPVYLFVLAFCVSIFVLAAASSQIFYVGKLMANLAHKAIVFASVFSFMLWLRSRTNPAWLALFLGTFFICLVLSTLIGGGRRVLLSVLIGPVLCVYMLYIRQWRPSRGVVAIGLVTVGIFLIGAMYNSIRHFSKGRAEERTAINVIKEVQHAHQTNWWQRVRSDTLRLLAQSNVHYALFTQRHVATGDIEPKLLNTLAFWLTVPIPRDLWPEKPDPLGGLVAQSTILPEDSPARLGCGIAGQAVYEGGLLVAALYGFLTALAIRFFDDPRLRQPTNPFLIAIFAAAASHLLGFPRGDLGVMGWEALECLWFGLAVGIGCRMLFGTDRAALAGARYFSPQAVLYRATPR